MSDDQSPLDFSQAIDNVEELKEFIKEQNREIARLKEVAETQALRVSCLESTVNDLRTGSEKKREEYEKAFGEVMADRDAWIESHENRSAEIEQLRKDVAQLKQSRVSRESAEAIGRLTEDRDKWERIAGVRQNGIDELKKGRDSWIETARNRATVVAELSAKLDATVAAMKVLEDKADGRLNIMGERQVKILDLERSLASTKSANEYLKRDLEEATATEVEQAKQIKELQVIVNDLNVRIHQMKTDGTDRYTWHMVEGYSKVIDTQSGAIREQEKTIDEQRKQVETLQDGLQDLRKRYEECVNQRVKMTAELESLRVSVQPYRPDSVVIPKSELKEWVETLRQMKHESIMGLSDVMMYLNKKIG